ncbi:MAG: DUF1460 domain-containing protein [Dysgonamonadaceae bacterium]|jgi:hypothetical protein|nr:DUF1460 domain-containing protein [Dysgonamonadaceae bacterium]
MLKTVFLILLLPVLPLAVLSQTKENSETKEEQIVRRYFASLPEDKKEPYSSNELIVKAALLLLNTPYAAATLEVNEVEELVVNLRESDCLTFVENCLALSRAGQYLSPDYEYFTRELRKIRYRNGVIRGYTSRLHYTSDWIFDNSMKGILEDITHALGGKRFKPNVYYMSAHPDAYPALKKNPQDTEIMAEIEKAINQRNSYYYIPRNEISEKTAQIKSGDIICFTTSMPGLDISHMGIACWNKGQLTFIHASSKAKKVIVNPESISNYCSRIPGNTGIIILRPLPVTNEHKPSGDYGLITVNP